MVSAFYAIGGSLLVDLLRVFGLIMLAMGAALAIAYVVYSAVRMYTDQRYGPDVSCFDESKLTSLFTIWIDMWFVNLTNLLAQAWQYVYTAATALFSNRLRIVGLGIIMTLALLPDTYLPELFTALHSGWTCFVAPILRPLLLPLINILTIGLDTITPVTNFLFVRLVRSLFLFPAEDFISCGTVTSVAFAGHIASAVTAFSTAIATWFASPMFEVGPDFGQLGGMADNLCLAVADMQTFATCTCDSAGFISDPFYSVWLDGQEPRQAINLTVSFVPVLVTQGIFRPVVYGAETFIAEGGVLNARVLDAFRPRVDSSIDTFTGAIRQWTKTIDAIWHQYYNLLLSDFLELLMLAAQNVAAVPHSARTRILAARITPAYSSSPPYPFVQPPPVIEIVADLVEASTTATLKVPWTWIANVDRVFGSYDGQLYWRLDASYDLVREAFRKTTNVARFIASNLESIALVIDDEDGSLTCFRSGNVDDVDFQAPNTGTCMLWVTAKIIREISTAAEKLLHFWLRVFRDTLNLPFGTAYTHVYFPTAYERLTLDVCTFGQTLPEDAARCELPEIGIPSLSNTSAWLAYAHWYWGDRSLPRFNPPNFPNPDHQFPNFYACPTQICARQRVCESDYDCAYGTDRINVCDIGYGRCIYNDTLCQNDVLSNGQFCTGPVPVSEIMCNMGKCNPAACNITGTAADAAFLCGCGCYKNAFNVTVSAFVDAVDHVGVAISAACGAPCQISADFLTSYVRVVREMTLFFIDVFIHTDDIIAWPSYSRVYIDKFAYVVDLGNTTTLQFGSTLRALYGSPDATCRSPLNNLPSLSFFCCLATAIETAYDISATIIEAAVDLVLGVIDAATKGLSDATATKPELLFQLRHDIEGPFMQVYRAMNRTRELSVSVACIVLQIIPSTALCPGFNSTNYCPDELCSYVGGLSSTGLCSHPASCAANTGLASFFVNDSCVAPPGICALRTGYWPHTGQTVPLRCPRGGNKFCVDHKNGHNTCSLGLCQATSFACNLTANDVIAAVPQFPCDCVCKGRETLRQGFIGVAESVADFVTIVPRMAAGLALSSIDAVLTFFLDPEQQFPPPACPIDSSSVYLNSGTLGCVVVATLDPPLRFSVSVGRAIGGLVSCLIQEDVGKVIIEVANVWGDIIQFFEEAADYIVNALVIIIELVLGLIELVFTAAAGKPTAHLWRLAFIQIGNAIGSAISAIIGEDAACILQDVTCLGGYQFLPNGTCSAGEASYCDVTSDIICGIQIAVCSVGIPPFLPKDRCTRQYCISVEKYACGAEADVCFFDFSGTFRPAIACCNEERPTMQFCFAPRFAANDAGCYQPGVTTTAASFTDNSTMMPSKRAIQPGIPAAISQAARSYLNSVRSKAKPTSSPNAPTHDAGKVQRLAGLYEKLGTSLQKWQDVDGTARIKSFARTELVPMMSSWLDNANTGRKRFVGDMLAMDSPVSRFLPWQRDLFAAVRELYVLRTEAKLRSWFPTAFPVADSAQDERITDIFQPLDCTINTAQTLCLRCSIADRFINATGLAIDRATQYYGTTAPTNLRYRFADNVARFNRGIDNTLTNPVGSDTFLTSPKTTPWIGDRLSTVQWPWLWNFTKFALFLDPTGTVFTGPGATLPTETAYTGTLVARQESNAALVGRNDTDLSWIAFFSSSALANSVVSRVVNATESIVYAVTGITSAGWSAIGRFLQSYFPFCDYDNTLYAINGRGTSLFDGLVVAGLFILLPTLISFLVLPTCGIMISTVMSTVISLTLWIPFALGIAYQGSPICFLPTMFPIPTFVPGIPVSLGQDTYELFSETLTQCAPIPVSLVDAADPLATGLCAECGVPPPRFKSCAEAAGFIDGFDNIFYTIEQIRPGTNQAIAGSGALQTIFPELASLAAMYTSDAIAASGRAEAMSACNKITFLSVFAALTLVLVFGLAVVATLLVPIVTAWFLYALFLATVSAISEMSVQIECALMGASAREAEAEQKKLK